MGSELQVPGLIRRVRREADLSQRELAQAVGVDRSLVGRWETGEVAPSIAMLERLLALGEMRLAVVVARGEVEREDEGERAGRTSGEVSPLRDDGVVDRARRRFPAHLDVGEWVNTVSGEVRPWAARRAARDVRRHRKGEVPRDHPSAHDLAMARVEARQRRGEALRERRLRLLRARVERGEPGEPQAPDCFCPVPCYGVTGCVSTCPCACEKTARQPS